MAKNYKKWLKKTCKRQMLANAFKCLQTLANDKKWQKMAQKCLQTENACKCLQMLANACKCLHMLPNDKKWPKITKNYKKITKKWLKNACKLCFSGIILCFPYNCRPTTQKMRKFITFWAFIDENTDCGHFSPFFACCDPGISVSTSQWVYLH